MTLNVSSIWPGEKDELIISAVPGIHVGQFKKYSAKNTSGMDILADSWTTVMTGTNAS